MTLPIFWAVWNISIQQSLLCTNEKYPFAKISITKGVRNFRKGSIRLTVVKRCLYGNTMCLNGQKSNHT